MSFADVLAAARELTAAERAELVRELAAPESGAATVETDGDMLQRLCPPGSTFEVWSPRDAHEAAVVLQRLLDEQKLADAQAHSERNDTGPGDGLAGDGLPDHLRQFLPPPGAAIPYWKPDLTAEGWEQMQRTLAELDATTTTHNPSDSK